MSSTEPSDEGTIHERTSDAIWYTGGLAGYAAFAIGRYSPLPDIIGIVLVGAAIIAAAGVGHWLTPAAETIAGQWEASNDA